MENKKEEQSTKDNKEKKPNELGGVLISTSIKISDPNTEEVLLQIRGN